MYLKLPVLLCVTIEWFGMSIETKEPFIRQKSKEDANDNSNIIYLSSNGTDNRDCLFYLGITIPCQTLSYIMGEKCTNGIGDKIIIHVLWNEIPITDCEWDNYLNKFNYFARFGPQCDLEISGIIDDGQMPIFNCLNSSDGKQSLPLTSRHIEFTNGFDYYEDINYQDTDENDYTHEYPMPKFTFSNLKFVGIIIDLTSIQATFENIIFDHSMIQHFPLWEYDCQISFDSCTFRRTSDDVANFGYPDWIPDYVRYFMSMRGDEGVVPAFTDGFLLGPWPHSPIFMERCKSVKFSMVNTSWLSGTIAIFYQQNAQIEIINSSFTNIEPFQTFIWIDDLSLMYFEMYDTLTDNIYNSTLVLSNVIFRDIQNSMINVPNFLRITSKSDTMLHVSNAIVRNTSGFLYAHLGKPHGWNGHGEILFTDISFIENESPTGLVEFSSINWAHIKIRNCIFKNNQALEPRKARVLELYNGNELYLPQSGKGLGAGLFIDTRFRSFKISNCTFLNNISPRGGGALHIGPGGGGWQKIIEIQDSSFECCETTIKLQSGYILSAESGLKLTNVTIYDHYMTKRYVPSILFKSIWEPLSMMDTYISCPKGNEIERNVKDTKKAMYQKGFARYDVACMSCSYPSFNNKPLHASYNSYEHESDHDLHNQTSPKANMMNVINYYPRAKIIEELGNTQCSTGNCPFGAICEGLLKCLFLSDLCICTAKHAKEGFYMGYQI